MRCAKERYLAIILIIAMILTCMPVTAFGLDIPAGYKENTESGSKISTNVYLTISASEDADDGSNTGGGDTSEGNETGSGDDGSGTGNGENTGTEDDSNIDKNKSYDWIVNYRYDDILEINRGSGKIGELIPYDLTTPKERNGQNYILESFNISKFITNEIDKNISDINYTLDIKDKNGNNISGGDGIPDKFQTSNDKYTEEDTFGYSVNYNYKANTGMISSVMQTGRGTVGSVIPYSYANIVDKDGQTFVLDSLSVNSNVITPNESDNKIIVNYMLTDKVQIGNNEQIKYMVSVDPANGSKINTYFVVEGDKLPDLSIPKKNGCEFVCWMDTDGNIVNVDTVVTSNIAIKAVWKLTDKSADYKVSHYKPAEANSSQEFKGFELVTVDKYVGEIGSIVQIEAKKWDGYTVDATNDNAIMSGVISADGRLELRVFYIKNDSNSDSKPDDSGNSSTGGSGGSGGGGGGGRPGKPVRPSDEKPTNPSPSTTDNTGNLNALVQLDSVNHIAYIQGYEDGTMRPNNSITRGEVAEIVYRLMTEDYRNKNYTLENSFSDVNDSVWCNASISTDAQAGVLLGYEDGEFKYNNNITRAEFAAIVSRFFTNYSDVQADFIDIDGHWAEKYINNVASAGWITGYADKTFRPDNYISRAEAVTIINRVLNRNVDENGLVSGIKEYPDVNKASWYYLAIQEAANAHTYSTNNGSEYWETIID